MSVAAQRKKPNFTEFTAGDSVIGITKEIKTGHASSMSILRDNGYEPMTHQQAIMLLDINEGVKRSLKGTSFWLADNGINHSGICNFDERGKLLVFRRDKNPEKSVQVWAGEEPLYMIIDSPVEYTKNERNEARFILIGYCNPNHSSTAIVGIKQKPTLDPIVQMELEHGRALEEVAKEIIKSIGPAEDALAAISQPSNKESISKLQELIRKAKKLGDIS